MNRPAIKPVPAPRSADRPTAEQLDEMIAAVLARIDRALPQFTHRFPAPSSKAGNYPVIANDEWTNGFWTGMLWLAWEHSPATRYRAAAEAQLASFVQRLARRINVNHHDLGFLYTLSACAAHQLTGSKAGRAAGIDAARLLLARFDPIARVIQAWGNMNEPEQRGRMIIDCNLNLPLLYWAANETGEQSFRAAADAHLDRAAHFLVRPDGSTYHTFYIDTATGTPRHGSTHQGFSDDSCWSRGQAWGIYGFALGFRNNGDSALLEVAATLASYFLERLPADGICCWDLIFTDDATQRDSSAAAIAACGLLELAAALPLSDPSRSTYGDWAWTIVRRLHQSYLAPLEGSNAVLAHAVYHMPNGVGVDESCIWGDYFYFEALTRLRRAWRPYW
jgi:unsaturated chondroitin disaccharide hydrolase